MRRGALAASVLAAALLLPGTAAAHLKTGRVAADYAATVAPLRPPLAGAVTVRVYEADLALGLIALDGHHVVVLGYTGEPFLRFGPGGAYANRSSLTAVGLGFATKGKGWRHLSRTPGLIWHDVRVRTLPAGVERARWSVPLLVDGTRAELIGELDRPREPSPWLWLAVGTGFAVTAGVLLTRRRPRELQTACAVLGWLSAGATLLVASGFAAASTASGEMWVEAGNELVFVLVGIGFLWAGSRDARALAGGALGLLALAVGLKSLPVLLHGVVLSALPADLMRAAVALAISAGAAATVVGLVVFFDVLEHYEEPAAMERYF